jgi:hypothetical protein
VLALAGMPLDDQRRELLEALEGELQLAMGPHAIDRLHVERAHVLALAEEAIAHPALLAAYGQRFGAEDPVTLVLYEPAPGSPDVAERLEQALLAAGLDEGGPDLLLVAPEAPVDGADAAVASGMVGLLSAVHGERAAFADLPRFAEDGVEELAQLVGRWTATRLAA